MDSIRAVPWHGFFSESGNLGALGPQAKRGAFTMGQHVLFPTFRVVINAFTAGDVTVFLRFGFQDPDAEAATEGINFALLAALNASDTRSPVWVAGAAAPNFNGNPNSVLPPRVSVQITTNAVTGFNGKYTVYYAGLQVT